MCLQVHASKLLLTDLLKVELGFRGLVVSDYNAVQQCGPSYEVALASCINAGVDMVMTAGGLWGDLPLEHQLRAARRCVEQGAIPLERIDDAVRRILRVKAAIGLPMPVPPPPAAPVAAPAAAPVPPPAAASQVALRMAADKAAYKAAAQRDQLHACVGCATHRRTAREAVRKSAVLLRLRNCVLPLKAESGAELLVCGRGADDLGMQCGGWTMQWQGVKGNSHTRGTTIWLAVQATGAIATLLAPGAIPPAPLGAGTGATAIAVLGEPPYAEGGGDTLDLTLRRDDAALVAALAKRGWRVVVVLLSGRPLVIPPETLEQMDALLAAWLPGTEGDGLVDLLFGTQPTSGRLSFSWPRSTQQAPWAQRQPSAGNRENIPLYPLGFGLDLAGVPLVRRDPSGAA